MASKSLNIEVGKRICKMCMTVSKGKAFQVSDSFVFATPDGAVVDGQIVNPAIMGEAIRDEMNLHNININNCVFSVASSKIAVREVNVPAIKDDQIKSIVATNASDYFPVDISKYTVSHTVLEKDKTKGSENSKILVAAVPTTIIEGYISLAESAGLIINSIDFSGNSQFQVLKGIGGENVNMFITIDSDSAYVTFMEDHKLLMQRTLNVGGDEMICRYMGLYEKDDDTYLESLQEISVSNEKFEVAADVEDLDDAMRRLVMGIARSVDFFHSGEYGDKEISRIILMGSCAHLIGIKEQISVAVGADSFWLEELSDIQGLANSVNDISVFISCLGARLAPMSLLPKEYLEKTGQSGSKAILGDQNLGYIVLGVFTGLAILMVGFAFFQNHMANKELADLNASVSSLQYAEDTYNSYLLYEKGKTDLQAFVDGADTHNKYLYDFFVELEAKMPSAISLLTADCNNDGVTLSVEVPSYDEAAVVIRQFRSFESIEVINVDPISKAEQEEGGAGIVSFTITCNYPVPTTTTTTTEASTEESTTEK
ncbi:MAG: pilus assembly protein PilM [Clostridia bacterium]|nr:pilus assembly protein PilM [Clostridia bacterium]